MEEEVWYEFSGDEYCDETCRGWDGGSRRCDCGNRRVSWECLKDVSGCNQDCSECEHGYAEAW